MILLPAIVESFLIAILLILLVIKILQIKKIPPIDKRLFFFGVFYLILLLSVFLSHNFSEGASKAQTMASLLIFPTVFFFFLGNNREIKRKKEKVLFVNYISGVIFSIISVIAFFLYENPRYPYKDSNFFRNAVDSIEILGDHPIYVSLLLSISIIIGLYFLKKYYHNRTYATLLILGELFQLSIFFLLMSKGIIFAMLTALVVLLILERKWKLIVVLIAFASGLLITIPKNNNRFIELFNYRSYTELDFYNSTSIRYTIFKCNMKMFMGQPIFGYGLGDVNDKLENCLSKVFGKEQSNYNSHNQYFNILLSTGILGLIYFLFFLFLYFRDALMYGDHLLNAILVIFCVSFLFENVLSRQTGVIAFSFLVNYLLFCNKKNTLDEMD